MRLTSLSLDRNDPNFSHRIRVGTYAIADMTDDYSVLNFEIQSDMTYGVKWFAPVDPSGSVHDYYGIAEGLASIRGGFGKSHFSWFFSTMTPGMIMYARTRMLDDKLSTPVTVMHWSRLSGWICANGIALWNEPADVAKPKGKGGFDGLKVDFVECVDAPET